MELELEREQEYKAIINGEFICVLKFQ